jgi:hypothetical protein
VYILDSCLTERNNNQISDIVTGWRARYNARIQQFEYVNCYDPDVELPCWPCYWDEFDAPRNSANLTAIPFCL